jgi:hypothetical protein
VLRRYRRWIRLRRAVNFGDQPDSGWHYLLYSPTSPSIASRIAPTAMRSPCCCTVVRPVRPRPGEVGLGQRGHRLPGLHRRRNPGSLRLRQGVHDPGGPGWRRRLRADHREFSPEELTEADEWATGAVKRASLSGSSPAAEKRTMGVTYDTGALIAADRRERLVQARTSRPPGAPRSADGSRASSDEGDLRAGAAAVSHRLEVDRP